MPFMSFMNIGMKWMVDVKVNAYLYGTCLSLIHIFSVRTIEFRPRASVDLDGILVYIALTLKSPQAARNTADAIFAAIERAAELPELGQPFFDEDLDHQGYRRVLVKRYWIYYTYDAHTLTVRRVFHTMQDTDCYGFELLDD